MIDVLLLLLRRLDAGETLIRADDVTRWPEGALAWLEGTGIISRAADGHRATCHECGEECLVSPKRGDRGLFHLCERRSDVNVVEFDHEALRRWRVQEQGFARALARALDLGGEPRLVGPTTWRLGGLKAGRLRPGVFFVPGLASLAAVEREARLARLGPGRMILLVPHRLPTGIPEDRAFVFALTTILELDDDGLFLSAEDLVSPFMETRPRKLVSCDLPVGTRWESLTIRIVSQTDLQVVAGGPPLLRGFADLGMADQRSGSPDAAWGTLLVFARERGTVHPENAGKTADFRHQVALLQRRLAAAFGLEGNPIHPHRPGVGWVSRFNIVDLRNNNAEDEEDRELL